MAREAWRMKPLGRLVGAVLGSALLGWLVASLILFAIFKVIEAQSTHPWASQVTGVAVVIILDSIPNALVATATLGLGWHAIASRRGWGSRRHYWLPGLAIGAIVGAAISLTSLVDFGLAWWPWALIGTVYASVRGCFTGLYAWLILRPDRAPANPDTAAA